MRIVGMMLVFLLGCAVSAPLSAAPRNVLLILADDYGIDVTQYYPAADRQATTPPAPPKPPAPPIEAEQPPVELEPEVEAAPSEAPPVVSAVASEAASPHASGAAPPMSAAEVNSIVDMPELSVTPSAPEKPFVAEPVNMAVAPTLTEIAQVVVPAAATPAFAEELLAPAPRTIAAMPPPPPAQVTAAPPQAPTPTPSPPADPPAA